MKKRRFQLRMPNGMNNLKISEIGNLIGKIPTRFKDYISLKFNRYNQEETYDDLSCGSVAPSSSQSSITRADKLNEPIIYNSGVDTLYNASILSDSASNFPVPGTRLPPPPPPPLRRNYEETAMCHYSEFYDQFGGAAYTSEIDNGHKFFKKPSGRTAYNKYANKKQKHLRLHY